MRIVNGKKGWKIRERDVNSGTKGVIDNFVIGFSRVDSSTSKGQVFGGRADVTALFERI